MRMRRLAIIGMVVGLVIVLTGSPPAGAVGSLTVTPSTGLVDGQQVTTDLSGFTPNQDMGMCQLVVDEDLGPDDCGNGTIVSFTSSETGSFSRTFIVRRRIEVPGLGLVDCAAPDTGCAIATAEIGNPPEGAVVAVPLSFAPPPDFLPDGQIVRLANGTLIGDDIYNSDGVSQQRIRAVGGGDRVFFPVRIENDGLVTDDITVTAQAEVPGFTVRYYYGYYDLTPFITTSGVTFRSIDPGERRTISVDIAVDADVLDFTMDVLVTMTSGGDPTAVDAVRVGVSVTAA